MSHSYQKDRPLFLSPAPCIKCFQWIDLAISPPDSFSPLTLNIFPLPHLRYIQAYKTHILRFSPTRQQVIWYVFEMWLYASGVIKRLIVTEMGKGLRVFFELASC